MLPDEGIGRVDGGIVLARTVICVNQIELCLSGLRAEREDRSEPLVELDRGVEFKVLQVLIGLLLQRRRAVQHQFAMRAAGEGESGHAQRDRDHAARAASGGRIGKHGERV